MSIRRSIDFELIDEIEYSKDGAEISSNKILLRAPTAKNRKECLFLKQAFLRALPKNIVVDPDNQEKDKEPEADDIIMLIGASADVDLAEFFETARNLMCRGVALIDGIEPLTNNLFDKIDFEDAQRLIGEYMINFILRSALMKQKLN